MQFSYSKHFVQIQQWTILVVTFMCVLIVQVKCVPILGEADNKFELPPKLSQRKNTNDSNLGPPFPYKHLVHPEDHRKPEDDPGASRRTRGFMDSLKRAAQSVKDFVKPTPAPVQIEQVKKKADDAAAEAKKLMKDATAAKKKSDEAAAELAKLKAKIATADADRKAKEAAATLKAAQDAAVAHDKASEVKKKAQATAARAAAKVVTIPTTTKKPTIKTTTGPSKQEKEAAAAAEAKKKKDEADAKVKSEAAAKEKETKAAEEKGRRVKAAIQVGRAVQAVKQKPKYPLT